MHLIASPALAFAQRSIFELSGDACQAAITQSALPTAVINTVLATNYDLEPSFVTGAVLISTMQEEFMAEKQSSRLHAIVEGSVQGVGFRMFVQTAAISLGVSGWVRNLWDGNVEVTAEGEQADLEKLLVALSQGPRGAYVINVHSEWMPATNEYGRFQVRSTA